MFHSAYTTWRQLLHDEYRVLGEYELNFCQSYHTTSFAFSKCLSIARKLRYSHLEIDSRPYHLMSVQMP